MLKLINESAFDEFLSGICESNSEIGLFFDETLEFLSKVRVDSFLVKIIGAGSK